MLHTAVYVRFIELWYTASCHMQQTMSRAQPYLTLTDTFYLSIITDTFYLFITGRPGLHVAQPCRYCFYSQAQKWVFRPTGPLPRANFHVYRGKNTAPKTVKISNFGQKFVPQGRLICNISTKFSAFVRVYR